MIAAVLFHAFNGVRIMAIDFLSKGALYQKIMFYIVLGLAIVCFIPMAIFVIAPLVGLSHPATSIQR